MTGDRTRVPPALEASTIPLGYRGGGVYLVNYRVLISNKYSSTNELSQKNERIAKGKLIHSVFEKCYQLTETTMIIFLFNSYLKPIIV